MSGTSGGGDAPAAEASTEARGSESRALEGASEPRASEAPTRRPAPEARTTIVPTTLVFVRREGRTLMIRKARGRQRGIWNGLGGKMESGETPEDCARREVREESGLEVETLDHRGTIVFPRFDDGIDRYVWVFLATARGEPRASDEGPLEWVPNDRITDLRIHEGDRVFLPWLDRPGIFSARFEYREGRFVGHAVVFYGAGA